MLTLPSAEGQTGSLFPLQNGQHKQENSRGASLWLNLNCPVPWLPGYHALCFCVSSQMACQGYSLLPCLGGLADRSAGTGRAEGWTNQIQCLLASANGILAQIYQGSETGRFFWPVMCSIFHVAVMYF